MALSYYPISWTERKYPNLGADLDGDRPNTLGIMSLGASVTHFHFLNVSS